MEKKKFLSKLSKGDFFRLIEDLRDLSNESDKEELRNAICECDYEFIKERLRALREIDAQ